MEPQLSNLKKLFAEFKKSADEDEDKDIGGGIQNTSLDDASSGALENELRKLKQELLKMKDDFSHSLKSISDSLN